MSADLVHMPMTGWGLAGAAVEYGEEPVRVRLDDFDVREYVAVPREVLPARFVLMAAALAHKFAGELGISVPEVRYFAEMTPELRTPWLERIEPEQRAAHLMRRSRLSGFAADERIWIDVAQSGADLVDVVAHEVAHVAGYDERAARAFGRAARTRVERGG